jgi:cyclomaltodextrinase
MDNVSWFKDSVIYHILIDRFADFKSIENWQKPQFLGGNIKGIIEKLPYLKELGINTIWISPFYKCNEYHGYHITDFFEVDRRFGTLDDIKNLIDSCHGRNIKIIADFVPNHCSNIHPYFIDAQKNKDSMYRDWFYFKNWPNDYLCFLSIKQLPKINLENKDAKNYIINAAKHWLSLGFDGFRLDHVIGPSNNFWIEFKKEIKALFPGAVLIGEAWMMGIKYSELKTIKIKNKFLKWLMDPNSDSLLKQYYNIFDGVLDFKFQEYIKDYIAYNKLSKNEFEQKIKNHFKRYPNNYFLPTFLDNHDMNRFLFECKNDKDKLRKAAEILFSIDQPKIIYYGTESGMSQEKSIWSFKKHGDLQARMPMNWREIDKELYNFYKKLISTKNR